jgi:hypothetical protein
MAEKSIHTFKDHFADILSGCAPTFLLDLWCQLLPQVERQLLLLQQLRLHLNIFVNAHVYGYHDYNKHPFVTIGMEALVQDKPLECCTYAEHCKKVFVLGRSTEHYRCWKFWSTATQATQILGAAFFKNKYLTNPSVTPEDLVIAMAKNLTQALETSIPQYLWVPTIQALKDHLEVFTDAAHKYSDNPAIRILNTLPMHLQQKSTPSPRVPPTPLGTPPPRVHPTMLSPKVPSILPTSAPSNVQNFMFPPEVSSVGVHDRTLQYIN